MSASRDRFHRVCKCVQPCRKDVRRQGPCDSGGRRKGQVQRRWPQLQDRQVSRGPTSSAQSQSQSTSGPKQLNSERAALAPKLLTRMQTSVTSQHSAMLAQFLQPLMAQPRQPGNTVWRRNKRSRCISQQISHWIDPEAAQSSSSSVLQYPGLGAKR